MAKYSTYERIAAARAGQARFTQGNRDRNTIQDINSSGTNRRRNWSLSKALGNNKTQYEKVADRRAAMSGAFIAQRAAVAPNRL